MRRALITGARAPVALHLARLFADAGYEVIAADTLRAPLAAASRHVARYHRLAAPAENPAGFAAALGDVIAAERPGLVIPTCEEIFYLAWAFETSGFSGSGQAPPPRLIAPSFAALARAHDKAVFAQDAKAFGLAPPETRRLTTPADLDRLKPDAHRLVFKPVWSRFAAKTLIAPDRGQLDRVLPSPRVPWVAQELVAGEELCAYAVAERGRITALQIYRPLYRAGLGAGIYFEPVAEPQIALDVAAYTQATQWSGQISFDFRRDAAGRPRVLECNPRATSGVHFFGPGTRLAAALADGVRAEPSVDGAMMVGGAMLGYALGPAIVAGRIGSWARDFRRAQDVMAWPGDRLSPWIAPRAMLELAGIARGQGTTLIEASTAGIAWDGQPIGQTAGQQDELLAAATA